MTDLTGSLSPPARRLSFRSRMAWAFLLLAGTLAWLILETRLLMYREYGWMGVVWGAWAVFLWVTWQRVIAGIGRAMG